jgi:pimeloyl-[acyl-carrier protein] methyl ester esterase
MPSDPPVRTFVLLPGMDGTGDLFAPFLAALPSSFGAIVATYPQDRNLTHPELITCARSFLPESDSYALLAESFSSPLAVQIAAEKPPNLKALVLCAGFVSSPMRGWMRRLLRLLGPPHSRLHLPPFLLRRVLLGQDAPDSLLETVKGAITAIHPEVLHSRLQMTATCDARAELAQVSVPILYLQAGQDRIVPSRCLDEIRRIKPETASVTIQGPHLLLQREPQAAVHAMVDLISRLN